MGRHHTAPPHGSQRLFALPLEACTITAEATEGEASTALSGARRSALFAHLGDGRMDLDAGDPTNNFSSLGAFNDIGETIEWRFDRGSPWR